MTETNAVHFLAGFTGFAIKELSSRGWIVWIPSPVSPNSDVAFLWIFIWWL